MGEIGRSVMEWYAQSLEQGLAAREKLPPELFIDTSQRDFVEQPMTVVERVYRAFVRGKVDLLKLDIEGGEYPLLHQAVEEGTLCEFVKQGNTADLFIEFHSQKVTGKHDYAGQTKRMKKALTECGVTFRNLAAWWA